MIECSPGKKSWCLLLCGGGGSNHARYDGSSSKICHRLPSVWPSVWYGRFRLSIKIMHTPNNYGRRPFMSGFALSLHGCIRDGPAPWLPKNSHEAPSLVLFSPAVPLVWGTEWRNNRKWHLGLRWLLIHSNI